MRKLPLQDKAALRDSLLSPSNLRERKRLANRRMGDSELRLWVTRVELSGVNGIDLGHQGDKSIPRRKKCMSEDGPKAAMLS